MTQDEERDLNETLEAMEDAWQKAHAAPERERSNVPDGKYQATVHRTLFDQGQDGTWRFKWELVIASGPCSGRHLFRTNQINESGIGYLKTDLARAGVTVPESLSGFRAMAGGGELLDLLLEVQTKTTTKNGKTYQNTYINGRIGSGNGQSAQVSVPAGDDNDNAVPF